MFLYGYGSQILRGLFVTLELSVSALLVSFVIGLLGALAKLSSNPMLRNLAMFYLAVTSATNVILARLERRYAIGQRAADL